jgi:hypothetical protein
MLSDENKKIIQDNKLDIKIIIIKQEARDILDAYIASKYFLNLYYGEHIFVVVEDPMTGIFRFTLKDEKTYDHGYTTLEECKESCDELVSDFLKQTRIYRYTFEEAVYP